MVRRALTSEEIEEMHRQEPGSAARYLDERRKELAAEKEKQREQEAKERFIEQFMAAGGTSKAEAEAAYKAHKNEQAAARARAADEAAFIHTRRHITQRL